MASIENNEKLQELLYKFKEDPSKLVDSFVRILNSTDSAYKRLNSKYRKLREENKHFKHDKDVLVKSEKMASINQFSMGIAHELNNPTSFILSNLNTLKKYIQTLLDTPIEIDKIKDIPEGSEFTVKNLIDLQQETDTMEFIMNDMKCLTEECLEGADRIKNIVKDLMFYKEDNKIPTQYSCINEVISSCINLVERRFEHKVIIDKNFGSLPAIKCYPNKLKQVFLNLLINAYDAMEKGGTISIKTELKTNTILVTFSDTGKGIKIKHLNRIFDPFFTTKEVGQGMGLGLSTVYSIIKLHNGDIEVDSSHGKGTIFYITLPFSKKDKDTVHQGVLEV